MKRFITALFVLTALGTSHLVAMEPNRNVAAHNQLKQQVYVKFQTGVANAHGDPNVLLECIHKIAHEYKDLHTKYLYRALRKAMKEQGVTLTGLRTRFQDTLLHYACRFGYLRSVKIILGAADNQEQRDTLLMMQDDRGMTALHDAYGKGNGEIVNILVNAISKPKLAYFKDIKSYPRGHQANTFTAREYAYDYARHGPF